MLIVHGRGGVGVYFPRAYFAEQKDEHFFYKSSRIEIVIAKTTNLQLFYYYQQKSPVSNAARVRMHALAMNSTPTPSPPSSPPPPPPTLGSRYSEIQMQFHI